MKAKVNIGSVVRKFHRILGRRMSDCFDRWEENNTGSHRSENVRVYKPIIQEVLDRNASTKGATVTGFRANPNFEVRYTWRGLRLRTTVKAINGVINDVVTATIG